MFSNETWEKLIAVFTERLQRRVTNPFDAEDLVQESLLVTLAKSHVIENDRHLHFYLQKVGQNQVANYQRRKQSERRKVAEAVLDLAPAEQSPPDEAYAYQELLKALADIACRLKPRERVLLEMLMRGASPDEICQAIGIDAQSRNVLNFRLKQKVKKLLAKKGYRFQGARGAGNCKLVSKE